VLPFRPLNFDQEEQYVGVGIADALITKLSHLKQIIARPTSSVLKYAFAQEDAAAVGRQLRVQSVIEGSIRRLGDRIRVTVQLVSTSDGTILWADSFDEKSTDIFKLEDRVSGEVPAALNLRLTSEEIRLLAKRYTENAQAYQLYMKGRYAWNRRTLEGFKQGVDYFSQAIGADPDYALAYAGLADCYIVLATYSLVPSFELGPKASAAAAKALEIDEHLAEAHASLAMTHLVYDWDWASAESEFKRSIELNENYATAHSWYALHLTAMGRLEDAIRETERAQDLDPLSLIITTNSGWILYFARRYDRAIEQCLKVIELEPNFWRPYLNLGWCYIERKMFDRAFAALSKASSLSDAPVNLAALGRAYAVSGQRDEALEILDRLESMAQHRYVSPYYIAEICLGLDKIEQAFECLEKAYEERVWFLVFHNQEPMFDPIRSDPRFESLSNRLGLPGRG
jgi:TolB-like protein/Tfp pilus assembly protein PilF